jgi:uncharacterized protein involved in outer membrane biogenesis
VRSIKIILVSFAILVAVLAVALVIFIKAFDLNRFKPQIIAQASSALNRKVDFERIGLGISLLRGIKVQVKNLVIAEDSALGGGDFLSVKNISLGVDVFKYLFRKEVNIADVLIDSPRLKIIRRKDGTLNTQSIAQPPAGAPQEAKPAPPAAASASMAIPAVFVSSVKGTGGTVIFIDQASTAPMRLEIRDLNFSLRRISLDKPFPFLIEASVLSAKKNIRVEGMAGFDLKTKEADISGLKISTELSDIALEKIPASFPQVKPDALPKNMRGKAQLEIKNLVAGPKGVTQLAAKAELSGGSMRFSQMAVPVRDITAKVNISDKKIILEGASFGIGDGKGSASGLIDDYMGKQDYNFEASAQGLNLRQIIEQEKFPVKAEGLAAGSLKIQGAGFSRQALEGAMSGRADVNITQVRLKNINILRQVLEKISVIPGLAEKFETGLPERFRQKLTQKDTALRDINIPVEIQNSRFFIRDAILEADEFIFKYNAEAGFDTSFLLAGVFLIPQDLSASMAAQAKSLQYLLDDSGQIYFPLKVSGKAGSFNFMVDLEYIGRQIMKKEAQKQLEKALNKAIGRKTDTQEPSPGEPPQGPDQKSPTEEIVGSILDTIFKK